MKYSQQFQQKMQVARYSDSTIRSYIGVLSSFFKANSTLSIPDITEKNIEKYIYKSISCIM